MSENIEKLKELTEKLTLRDGLLRLIETCLNNVEYGFVLTDIDGTVLWCNNYFLKNTQYDYIDLIGKKTNIFKSGKHNIEFYSYLWKTILSGSIFKGIIINRKKDGTLYNEYNIISPVLDENNKIKYFFALKEDLTKNVGNGLFLNKEILNAIPFPIYCLDENGNFIYINNKMCEKYKYTEKEFISNLTIFDINKDLSLNDWLNEWNNLKASMSTSTLINAIHYTKDGIKLKTVISACKLIFKELNYSNNIILFQETEL